MRPTNRSVLSVCFALLLILLLAACDVMSESEDRNVANATEEPALSGSIARGEQHLMNYGCGACHVIPGVSGAYGQVGPSLVNFAQRRIIVGELVNTPENVLAWIENPQAIQPETTMPDVNAPSGDAADMTAYLFSLR